MKAPVASTCPAPNWNVIVPSGAMTIEKVCTLPMSVDFWPQTGGLPTAVKVACPCQLPA